MPIESKPFGQYTQRFTIFLNEKRECWDIFDNRNNRVVASCKAESDAMGICAMLNAADKAIN